MRYRQTMVVLGLWTALASAPIAMAGDIGKPTPSFGRAELDGRAILLDDDKAEKNVILVFYVGHQ